MRENAVLAPEKTGEDKRLIAYLLSGTPAPTAADLKTFLKAKLPDYMVPSGFVFVNAWPLTPNGKVDRQALSTIDWKPAAGGEGFIACRKPLEQQLADIWMRALGVERLGATDNFFDLGGHSLLAVRVCSQIEKSSGKRLPLTAFFEAPTVEGLARLLSDETPARIGSLFCGYRPWDRGRRSSGYTGRPAIRCCRATFTRSSRCTA